MIIFNNIIQGTHSLGPLYDIVIIAGNEVSEKVFWFSFTKENKNIIFASPGYWSAANHSAKEVAVSCRRIEWSLTRAGNSAAIISAK